MANELNTMRPTGETLTARLVQAGAYVGGSITMTESGTVPGLYTGDVPGGTADGTYQVLIYKAGVYADRAGLLVWANGAEFDPLDVPRIHGLVTATPLVVSPTARTAGSISQTITDASGTVTVQRV